MIRSKKIRMVRCVILLAAVLNGCSIGDTKYVLNLDSRQTEVFRINEEACTVAETKVFLTNYQNIYARMYDVDLWEYDFGEQSLEKYVKDITIAQLAQIKSMKFLAEQQGISLTGEENEQVKKATDDYYDSLNENEIRYMDVDRKTIESLYEQYGLAHKLYNFLTKDVNNEVSEDEARVMEALQVRVSDKARAEEIEKRLKSGEDFAVLAASLAKENEVEETEVKAGRGYWPPKVEEKAFALSNGESTGCIQTEDGYYFVKCMNNYNQQLTEENKSDIVEKKRKAAFDDVYDEFIAGLPSEFNQEVWDRVKIKMDDKVTTASFFDVFHLYCKW